MNILDDGFKIWHAATGPPDEDMLIGQAQNMLMGQAHDLVLMGLACGHMLMGDPSRVAAKINWRLARDQTNSCKIYERRVSVQPHTPPAFRYEDGHI